MENNNFDKKVADYLNHRKMEVSPDAWQKLAKELPRQPKSNKNYWIVSVAAVLVLGVVWMLRQNTENAPITVVEPPTEINANPVHSVSADESKQVENANITKTPTNLIPIAKQSKKQVNSNQTNSTISIKEEPILNVKKTNALILAEVTKSIDNNEFKDKISNEKSFTELVLSNLDNNKTQYKIDPNDLLKLAESEIKKEKEKRFREKVFDKVKSTMNDLNIALK